MGTTLHIEKGKSRTESAQGEGGMKITSFLATGLLLASQAASAGTTDMVTRALNDALRDHADVKSQYGSNEMEDAAHIGLADRSDRMALELSVDVGSVRRDHSSGPSMEAEPPVQDQLGSADLLDRTPAKLQPVIRDRSAASKASPGPASEATLRESTF